MKEYKEWLASESQRLQELQKIEGVNPDLHEKIMLNLECISSVLVYESLQSNK